MNNIGFFYLKIFLFLVVKFSIYWNRHVFAMPLNIQMKIWRDAGKDKITEHNPIVWHKITSRWWHFIEIRNKWKETATNIQAVIDKIILLLFIWLFGSVGVVCFILSGMSCLMFAVVVFRWRFVWARWGICSTSQSAFHVNIYRTVIGPSG